MFEYYRLFGSWEFNTPHPFFTFPNNLNIEKVLTHLFEQTWKFISKDASGQIRWNLLSGSWVVDCLNLTPCFHSFLIISPLRENKPFIWKKTFPPMLLCAKLFWMRFFFNNPTLFPYFLIISRLKENLVFYFKNFP